MITMIVVLVGYYLAGWILYGVNQYKVYKLDVDFPIFVMTLCALWPIWVIWYCYKKHLESKCFIESKFKVHIETDHVPDVEGLAFVEGRYTSHRKYAYYSFATERYAGYIDIDVRTADVVTLKKITKILYEWGESEKEKNAYMAAYGDSTNRL